MHIIIYCYNICKEFDIDAEQFSRKQREQGGGLDNNINLSSVRGNRNSSDPVYVIMYIMKCEVYNKTGAYTLWLSGYFTSLVTSTLATT